jgi:hypothetical protein
MTWQHDGVWLVEPDKHFPDADPRCSRIILEVLNWLRPTGYINMGDLGDFPQLSTHEKDPRAMRRVEDDIAEINVYLDEIETSLPRGSEIHLLEGNHEARLKRYCMRQAKELIGVAPSWPTNYRFDERTKRRKCKWFHHDYTHWNSCRIADTIFHHGFYYDQHTAMTNLVRYRHTNFVQGHSHRTLYASNGDYWSATLGHTVLPERSNHAPTPGNHEQAFGIYSVRGGHGQIEIYRIKNGVAVVRGRIFRG